MSKMLSARLEDSLFDWTTQYASAYGWDRTQLITELLIALREGRVDVRPRAGVSPFPVHEVDVGSTPECPALISR